MVYQTDTFANARIITDGHNRRIIDAHGTDVVKFIEDFVGTPIATDNITGWTTTLVETGSGETTVTQGDETGGKLLITTDDADNDGANIVKLGESFRVDNNSLYFGIRMKMSENTQSDFFVGLAQTDTNILGNLPKRIGFRKVDGETGTSFETKKTNTTSVTNIHQVVNATYVVYEFLYDKTAGKLRYWVDGTEYGPVDYTNLPDTELAIAFHCLSGSASAKTFSIDWVRVFQFGRS